MTERVLLIDVDSTIPNFALMKISTFWKSRGAEVGFNISNPTKVYASCIFRWNAHKVDGLRFIYPDADIDIGGTGISLSLSPGRHRLLLPRLQPVSRMGKRLGDDNEGMHEELSFLLRA